jgi:hypothetical protein
MFTRDVSEHNVNTTPPPNAIVRPRTGWFSQPTGAGSYFGPPAPRAILDTNGDYIYLLASSPTQHSNPRYQGSRNVEGGNTNLQTTIFG